MKTLEEIMSQAKRDFQNRLRIENPKSSEGIAIEISRNCIPSSSKEILLLAARNLDLALDEPAGEPAFDGRNKAINLIAANIQRRVYLSLTKPQEGPFLNEGDHDEKLHRTYERLLAQLNPYASHDDEPSTSSYTENLYLPQNPSRRKA